MAEVGVRRVEPAYPDLLPVTHVVRPGYLPGAKVHNCEVRSALVDTLGADVVDVFYLTDSARRPLAEDVAESVRDQVSEAIGSRA